MINNKYAVGHRYQLKDCPTLLNGIIEITEITLAFINFKIVEGIDDWRWDQFHFQENSAFARYLYHIEKTRGETS